MPALNNRGTRYECNGDETRCKHNGFHPGKRRNWDERNGTLASYPYNLRRSGGEMAKSATPVARWPYVKV